MRILISFQRPYPPNTAAVGGLPTIDQDVPPLVVFLVLYLIGAILNIITFRRNRNIGHKFFISIFIFYFCLLRMVTVTLRIVWATKQTDVSIAIAAQIFVNAGILIIYVINLLLAHRILRSLQPKIGWHQSLNIGLGIIFGLIAIFLILIITFTVLSFYTFNQHIRNIARDIQKAATTYLLAITILPLVIILFGLILPRSTIPIPFGHGSLQSKVIILIIGTCFCILIAGFRSGTTWESPRPINQPAWYDDQECFYIFNLTFDILIIYLYAIARIDKRFHVPDGSGKAKSYDLSEGFDKSTQG
jgi:hypothetical protein